MKVTTTILFMLMNISILTAQELPVDKETGKVTYSEVLEAPGQTKDVIYTKVRSWVSESFRSSKAVIDLEDKENGKLVAKGNMSAGVLKNGLNKVDAGRVNFTMTFLIKDDKLKVVSTNFIHEANPLVEINVLSCGNLENVKCGNGVTSIPSSKQWKQIKEDVNDAIIELYGSLKKNLFKSNEMDF